ncbi:helix-turn-helix domain-containing protein [Rhizobium vallis]|uniref:helix-turn-helix domain-containing protein n=1 Tax=Rhizobium vallis TaxID=634290 RepID=UPI003CCB4768
MPYHVANGRGLSAAARALGLSAATAGRRVLALEQATKRTLPMRSQSLSAHSGWRGTTGSSASNGSRDPTD